jgi:hypothetical protein
VIPLWVIAALSRSASMSVRIRLLARRAPQETLLVGLRQELRGWAGY